MGSWYMALKQSRSKHYDYSAAGAEGGGKARTGRIHKSDKFCCFTHLPTAQLPCELLVYLSVPQKATLSNAEI